MNLEGSANYPQKQGDSISQNPERSYLSFKVNEDEGSLEVNKLGIKFFFYYDSEENGLGLELRTSDGTSEDGERTYILSRIFVLPWACKFPLTKNCIQESIDKLKLIISAYKTKDEIIERLVEEESGIKKYRSNDTKNLDSKGKPIKISNEYSVKGIHIEYNQGSKVYELILHTYSELTVAISSNPEDAEKVAKMIEEMVIKILNGSSKIFLSKSQYYDIRSMAAEEASKIGSQINSEIRALYCNK